MQFFAFSDLDNSKFQSSDPIDSIDEDSEEPDRIRKKPRNKKMEQEEKKSDMVNEETQYRLSSEDLSKYPSYTSIDTFIKNARSKHIGRENCAIIRYVSDAEFPKLDVLIEPWKPYVIFKIWIEYSGKSNPFYCIRDFDFFPKSDYPNFCGPLTEVIYSSRTASGSILVPRMKTDTGDIVDDTVGGRSQLKFFPLTESYLDHEQQNQIYLTDNELLERIETNGKLEEFEITPKFNFSTHLFNFGASDPIEEDSDSDSSEEEEKTISELVAPKKTIPPPKKASKLRYPINKHRTDPKFTQFKKTIENRTKYEQKKVDRVMRSMIGRCMDKLFVVLTEDARMSVCVDDDSPVLANLLTQYTHNREFWIKMMRENKLAVRLDHMIKGSGRMLQPYFNSSIQYTGTKVWRNTGHGHSFDVWGTVKWFNLAQMENDTDEIVKRHILFYEKMKTDPEYKTKIDWYVNHQMKLDEQVPKNDPEGFKKWRDQFIDEKLIAGKDEAYDTVHDDFFFSNSFAMDWSLMKISMDGFMVYVYEVLPDNSCIFLRLTTMDDVEDRPPHTLKNVIVIDYFEHTKVNSDKKKSSDPKSTSSVYIKRLADAYRRAGFTLLVNTVASSPGATGFWDKMHAEKNVELSESAVLKIEQYKRHAVEEHVTNYFYEILKKQTLGDMRRDWITIIPKVIKAEFDKITVDKEGRFKTSNIEASCELPCLDSGRMTPRVTMHRNDMVILLKK